MVNASVKHEILRQWTQGSFAQARRLQALLCVPQQHGVAKGVTAHARPQQHRQQREMLANLLKCKLPGSDNRGRKRLLRYVSALMPDSRELTACRAFNSKQC